MLILVYDVEFEAEEVVVVVVIDLLSDPFSLSGVGITLALSVFVSSEFDVGAVPPP
jgi:hypothetical protein